MKVSIILLLCTILFTIQSSALKSTYLPTSSTTNENIINITIKQATPLYNKISNSIQQHIIPIISSSSSKLFSSSSSTTDNNTILFTKRQQQNNNNDMIQINSSSTAEGIQHNGPVAALAMAVLFCILTF